jgi:hypothetical protein
MSVQQDNPLPFSCTVQLEGQAAGECERNAIRARISEATASSALHVSQAPFLSTLNALMDDSRGCILTNESRLVPILLYERHANAKPVTLIQINAQNSECVIHLYPHLTGQGCTTPAKLSLIFKDLLVDFRPALPDNIQSLRWHCDGGIPVGLHAHESLLRSSNSETHFPETETQISAVALVW